MIKIIGLFVLTALTKIFGCYCVYVWFKKAASNCFLALAALCLMLFAWLLSLHPEASGRIYATYGGIYIVVSIGWLKFVDNIKLSTFDLIGAGIILLGTLVIVLGWRS